MSSGNKDSPEVVKFMTLFTRLKDWCDDAPDDLADLTATDDSVRDLCDELSYAVLLLKRSERRQRALFTGPVDPVFLAAWRDYGKRYENVVQFPVHWLLDMDEWEDADATAAKMANGVDTAIEYAQNNVEWEGVDNADYEDFVQRVKRGVAEWDRLRQDIGFDLRGVFRRRALVPFVLVPRKVAARHGSAEKLSMLKNLQQAHEAFIFGAPYATLALMRSITEVVLRDHYGAKGENLNEFINNASFRLPRGVTKAALHRLRMLANVILHLGRKEDEKLPRLGEIGLEKLSSLDEIGLEKEIVSLLFVLRGLIEGVK